MEVSKSQPEPDRSEEDADQIESSAREAPQSQEQEPQEEEGEEENEDEEEEEEEEEGQEEQETFATGDEQQEDQEAVVMEDGQEGEASYADYKALFEESDMPLWDTINVSKALEPLTEEEKQRLRAKLPKQLANFLIRRADAAVRLRNTKPGDSSFIGNFLSDLPPDKVAWDDPANEEFRDYVYETTTGPPSYRRQGSSLFGGGDGLPDMEDLPDAEGPVETSSSLQFPKKLMSMFVGNVDSVDEQAAKVGYTLLALFVLLVAAKIIFAFISFFLSFTFSFLSIFALSAGIFVVFYLFRF